MTWESWSIWREHCAEPRHARAVLSFGHYEHSQVTKLFHLSVQRLFPHCSLANTLEDTWAWH